MSVTFFLIYEYIFKKENIISIDKPLISTPNKVPPLLQF